MRARRYEKQQPASLPEGLAVLLEGVQGVTQGLPGVACIRMVKGPPCKGAAARQRGAQHPLGKAPCAALGRGMP
jgi:hypothetical protein